MVLACINILATGSIKLTPKPHTMRDQGLSPLESAIPLLSRLLSSESSMQIFHCRLLPYSQYPMLRFAVYKHKHTKLRAIAKGLRQGMLL